MKRKYFILLIIPLLFIACNNDEHKAEENNVEDVPPSLKREQNTPKVITLSDKEVRELHIKTVTVQKKKRNYTIVSPGMVQPAPNYISFISAPVDGRIVSLPVNEGERVYKGQVLMEIESLEYGKLISEYLKSSAEADYYKNKYERMKKLTEKKISSESELEQVQSDYKRAQATEDASISMLRAIGVSQKVIHELITQEDIDPVLKITSPISGIINDHLVELGQSVKAYEKMASVINTKKLLIKAYISPEEGQYVNPGDTVDITQRKSSRKNLKSTISTVNPGLDIDNRSVVANIMVKPVENWPVSGENVRLEITTASPVEVIAIPMDAITYDDDEPVAFVKLADNKFEKRILQVNDNQGDFAIVQSGVKENEEVAVSQVFSLKALARYEQFAD